MDGRIVQVLQNTTQLPLPDLIGKMAHILVAPGELPKLLNFFLEVKENKTAIGWEINLALTDQIETFTFFGGLFGADIVVAASPAQNTAEELFAEVTRINNEQTNIIRSISKENAQLKFSGDPMPLSFFDELSRLNNELVNMQRELAKKNRELDTLNKLKNQFLGIAAHDLRNPIGIVLGYSEFLMENGTGTNPDETKELIGRIHQTAGFMLTLVNNLLDISSIESGQLELNKTETDVAALIREIVNNFGIIARAKSIHVLVEGGEKPITLSLDKPKMEQVINNLLSNAVKYSFPGTTIIIKLTVSGEILRIEMTDQGQGIRKEEIERLFKPFQKSSTRPTAGEKSTGLGLAIVKKIMDAHAGSVGVESEFGKGSTFFVTLSLHRSSQTT